ncbi:uncharacterized protein LOC117559081 isoform X1 [Gymnodraco acuticeps]|uniref:Uncharacterized protein LOC117559081 isoform X1 n=1 Tax=Gymnodraco acuticeps TaxID=8218 RepID=A0A6P8W0D7_GYMAC|nr:uncharacterized protein LOC117559081 isoform X1 [Gymnodraco acuticeps]
MVCCFAPGCSHRSSHETCSFYRFPANVFQRRVWIRAMRRADRKPNTLTTTTLQRPSGDAPNNPDWESHKPDSWTCIWVAVVNALTPSHSFIVPHCTDKTPSRACCCPSTLALREAVTRFDLRTAPKLLAVNLPFLNKCQFGSLTSGSHLNCPLLLLRQCHACHNCLRSLMPNRFDNFRNSKCFQAVVFLFWLGGEKPRHS